MSQRAAWQLERLGFTEVYDFVHGKAYWRASGRPTVRTDGVVRVGECLSSPPTAEVGTAVADLRDELSDGGEDVVVVAPNGVVYGRVRRSALYSGAADAVVGDIVREGPTTIRPDETADTVRTRMSERGVTSMIVTKPTGQLLGVFDIDEDGDQQ